MRPLYIRLWKEKRGEAEPEDLSGNLIVQLGLVTEDLNRRWYELNSGGNHHRYPTPGASPGNPLGWQQPLMAVSKAATPYSRPSSCCRGRSRKRRRQRNTCRSCSTICGWSGPGPRSSVDHYRRRQVGERSWRHADPLYQHLIVTAERKFWRCAWRQRRAAGAVRGRATEAPGRGGPQLSTMSTSNAWAEFAGVIRPHPGGASGARAGQGPN